MSDTPSLEDRLVAWLAFLGSEKAETTPIASVVCPTGESLADDLRAALATLSPPAGERREAIARMIDELLQADLDLEDADRSHFDARFRALRSARTALDTAIDNALASGLVQDEAGWLPISTAPKDGTIILAFWTNGERHTGSTDGVTWFPAWDRADCHWSMPTYWKSIDRPAIRSARDGGAS